MKFTLAFFTAIVLFFTACADSDGWNKSYIYTVADVGGSPDGVAVADSEYIYITDVESGEIKQISPEGTVTTLAGIDAGHPDGITAVTDAANGNDILYVTDTGSTDPEDEIFSNDGSVLKIVVDLDTGDAVLSEFVDSAVLDNPTGIAADADGNLYVADQGTGDVYKVPVTSDVAGTPESLTQGDAVLDQPHGLTLIENEDNTMMLYTTDVAAASNNIVKIEIPASGEASEAQVTDLTPDSTGGDFTDTIANSTFDNPHGISVNGNRAVFVADENNNRVQIITHGGNVVNFAGSGTEGDTDGIADTAQLSKPRGIAVDNSGNVLVCDYGNGKVKKIVP